MAFFLREIERDAGRRRVSMDGEEGERAALGGSEVGRREGRAIVAPCPDLPTRPGAFAPRGGGPDD